MSTRTGAEGIPRPPENLPLEPLFEVWKSGRPFVRCHSVRFGATEFNPGIGSGRFHPVWGWDGGGVPTLYAADSIDGALSETVFHGIPYEGVGKALRRSVLLPMVVSTLAASRDLKLVQLHGYGLRRLGISRRDLIESEAGAYPTTRLWAQALHRSEESLDGLVWVSRQYDTSRALVLFGDRVRRADLDVVESPLPLHLGPGLGWITEAAEKAGITLLE